MLYQGSCHCGNVRFEVEAPEPIEADYCNCGRNWEQNAHKVAHKSRET